MEVYYKPNDIVWVKLGPFWWPGEVLDKSQVPSELTENLKKEPVAIVKFFDEDGFYEFVKSPEGIFPYNCEKKYDFIKKGMDAFRAKNPKMASFPKDVSAAEIKTGGNANILSDPIFTTERKRNYAAEIFGSPTVKRPRESKQGRAIKSEPIITHRRFLGYDDYEARVLIPTSEEAEKDDDTLTEATLKTETFNKFTCPACQFSTDRLGILMKHTSCHIKEVSFQSRSPIKKIQKRKRKKALSDEDDLTSDDKKTKAKRKYTKKKVDESLLADDERSESDMSFTKDSALSKYIENPVQPPVTEKKDICNDIIADWDDESNHDDTIEDSTLDITVTDGQETVTEEFALSEFLTTQPAHQNLPSSDIREEKEDKDISLEETKVSAPETSPNISCFDFDENEEETKIPDATSGRKIPRVIPISERRKTLEQEEEEEEENRKKKILEESQELAKLTEETKGEDKETEHFEKTYQSLMEETENLDIPDIPNALKTEQNFHSAKTVKYPDKTEESSNLIESEVVDQKISESEVLKEESLLVASKTDAVEEILTVEEQPKPVEENKSMKEESEPTLKGKNKSRYTKKGRRSSRSKPEIKESDIDTLMKKQEIQPEEIPKISVTPLSEVPLDIPKKVVVEDKNPQIAGEESKNEELSSVETPSKEEENIQGIEIPLTKEVTTEVSTEKTTPSQESHHIETDVKSANEEDKIEDEIQPEAKRRKTTRGLLKSSKPTVDSPQTNRRGRSGDVEMKSEVVENASKEERVKKDARKTEGTRRSTRWDKNEAKKDVETTSSEILPEEPTLNQEEISTDILEVAQIERKTDVNVEKNKPKSEEKNKPKKIKKNKSESEEKNKPKSEPINDTASNKVEKEDSSCTTVPQDQPTYEEKLKENISNEKETESLKQIVEDPKEQSTSEKTPAKVRDDEKHHRSHRSSKKDKKSSRSEKEQKKEESHVKLEESSYRSSRSDRRSSRHDKGKPDIKSDKDVQEKPVVKSPEDISSSKKSGSSKDRKDSDLEVYRSRDREETPRRSSRKDKNISNESIQKKPKESPVKVEEPTVHTSSSRSSKRQSRSSKSSRNSFSSPEKEMKTPNSKKTKTSIIVDDEPEDLNLPKKKEKSESSFMKSDKSLGKDDIDPINVLFSSCGHVSKTKEQKREELKSIFSFDYDEKDLEKRKTYSHKRKAKSNQEVVSTPEASPETKSATAKEVETKTEETKTEEQNEGSKEIKALEEHKASSSDLEVIKDCPQQFLEQIEANNEIEIGVGNVVTNVISEHKEDSCLSVHPVEITIDKENEVSNEIEIRTGAEKDRNESTEMPQIQIVKEILHQEAVDEPIDTPEEKQENGGAKREFKTIIEIKKDESPKNVTVPRKRRKPSRWDQVEVSNTSVNQEENILDAKKTEEQVKTQIEDSSKNSSVEKNDKQLTLDFDDTSQKEMNAIFSKKASSEIDKNADQIKLIFGSSPLPGTNETSVYVEEKKDTEVVVDEKLTPMEDVKNDEVILEEPSSNNSSFELVPDIMDSLECQVARITHYEEPIMGQKVQKEEESLFKQKVGSIFDTPEKSDDKVSAQVLASLEESIQIAQEPLEKSTTQNKPVLSSISPVRTRKAHLLTDATKSETEEKPTHVPDEKLSSLQDHPAKHVDKPIEVATKLTNPKKRFVKCFEDSELNKQKEKSLEPVKSPSKPETSLIMGKSPIAFKLKKQLLSKSSSIFDDPDCEKPTRSLPKLKTTKNDHSFFSKKKDSALPTKIEAKKVSETKLLPKSPVKTNVFGEIEMELPTKKIGNVDISNIEETKNSPEKKLEIMEVTSHCKESQKSPGHKKENVCTPCTDEEVEEPLKIKTENVEPRTVSDVEIRIPLEEEEIIESSIVETIEKSPTEIKETVEFPTVENIKKSSEINEESIQTSNNVLTISSTKDSSESCQNIIKDLSENKDLEEGASSSLIHFTSDSNSVDFCIDSSQSNFLIKEGLKELGTSFPSSKLIVEDVHKDDENIDVSTTEIITKNFPLDEEQKEETEYVSIDGNLTVVSEKELAEGQVEITASMPSKKPISLMNFSMDFSDDSCDNSFDVLSKEKIKNITESLDVKRMDDENSLPQVVAEETVPQVEVKETIVDGTADTSPSEETPLEVSKPEEEVVDNEYKEETLNNEELFVDKEKVELAEESHNIEIETIINEVEVQQELDVSGNEFVVGNENPESNPINKVEIDKTDCTENIKEKSAVKEKTEPENKIVETVSSDTTNNQIHIKEVADQVLSVPTEIKNPPKLPESATSKSKSPAKKKTTTIAKEEVIKEPMVIYNTAKSSTVTDMCDLEDHIPSQIVCTKFNEEVMKVTKELKKEVDTSAGETEMSKLLSRLTTDKKEDPISMIKASETYAKVRELDQSSKPDITTPKNILKGAIKSKTVTVPLPPVKSSNKAIILSEKIIRPAREVVVATSAQKRVFEDVEDIAPYVIAKTPKLEIKKDDPVVPPKTTPTPKNQKNFLLNTNKQVQPVRKTTGKAKILNQTIIRPASEAIQTKVPTEDVDNVDFDINSMPIVLSDELLTPETLESMPIVIGEQAQKTAISVPVSDNMKIVIEKRAQKVLTKTIPISSSPASSSAGVRAPIMKRTTPKILQAPKITQKIVRQMTPAVSSKQKFVVMSDSPNRPQQIMKKHPNMLRKPVPATCAASSAPSESTGHKIMIFTNPQGKQQRLLLTPAQQKLIGMQLPGKTVMKSTTVTQKSQLGKVQIGGLASTSKIVSQGVPSAKLAKTTVGTSLISATTPIKIVPPRIKTSKILGQQIVRPPQQKTMLVSNQQGQIRKIQGTNEALLDKQVAEQLEAIKVSSMKAQQKQHDANMRGAVPKSHSSRKTAKRPEHKQTSTTQPKPSASTKMPPLSPLKPVKKQHEEKQSESKPLQKLTDRPLTQMVLKDHLGVETTVVEGQVLALPSETLGGQPNSYMLVTLDKSGNLTPLDNEALMNLDPNLLAFTGGDLSNMVLQVDPGTSKPLLTNEPPPPVQDKPKQEVQQVVPAKPKVSPLEEQAQVQVTCNLSGESGQQIILTGDPASTQKFLDSLTNGGTDLASILAGAEGNSFLIQADGQQILINTEPSEASNLLEHGTNVVEQPDQGNPMFSTPPGKNQDILAAALADTDVFQQDQVTSQSKLTHAQLSPGQMFPANVGGVLETSLTLNSPIMTPLEVPSTNSKRIPDDGADILSNVPKALLPITITDPNIIQTVSHQQVMIASDLQNNLELSLPISETSMSVTSEMTSPTFVYSLPNLDVSEHAEISAKNFSSSMPLLTEEMEDKHSFTPTTTKSDDLGASKGNDLEKRSNHGGKHGTFIEEGLCTLGAEMCSSLSEPPPEMFDIPMESEGMNFLNKPKEKSNLSSLESALLSDDNSLEVSVQSEIVPEFKDSSQSSDFSSSQDKKL